LGRPSAKSGRSWGYRKKSLQSELMSIGPSSALSNLRTWKGEYGDRDC
jgi:hypothetical protein